MDKVLSEVDKGLNNFYMTARRLDYKAPSYDDLGKFIVSYFLERDKNDSFKDRKEREYIRKDLAERLQDMSLLLVGSGCPFARYFGDTDSFDDLYFMEEALAYGEADMGRYDLVISSSIHDILPSEHRLYMVMKERLQALLGKSLETSFLMLGFMQNDFIQNIIRYGEEEGIDKLHDMNLPVFCSDKNDIQATIKNFEALKRIASRDYLEDFAGRHIKPGGILIDTYKGSSLREYSSLRPLDHRLTEIRSRWSGSVTEVQSKVVLKRES